MRRRELLERIGATSVVAVPGAAAAASGGTDGQLYFVEETDDGH